MNTNAEPLRGFQAAENLGLALIANTVQNDKQVPTNYSNNALICSRESEKMKRLKVDLHVNHIVTPVAQSHRKIPFSIRPKLKKELE